MTAPKYKIKIRETDVSTFLLVQNGISQRAFYVPDFLVKDNDFLMIGDAEGKYYEISVSREG